MAGVAYSATPTGGVSVSPALPIDDVSVPYSATPTGGVALVAVPFAEFEFQQGVAASTWAINHGRGYHPGVRVLDSAGTLVEGTVSYPDANNITVSFSAPFAGTAYLS
jgi:hypothetical protein